MVSMPAWWRGGMPTSGLRGTLTTRPCVIQVSVQDAQARLESLVEAARQGEPVVLTDAGVPIAKIVPYAPPRQSGQWGGQVWISDDFDAPMPEIEDLFGT